MMMIKKLVVGLVVLLGTFFSLGTNQIEAQEVQTVIDEAYVQPDYVLGYSLSEEQRTTTLGLLSYDSAKDTNVKTLTTAAYSSIMNVDGSALQLYSSVRIKKLGASETLSVTIVTPENITKVTEDMYRNAAVTLGIEHAEITVASPIMVTGESALAGIYYSLEQNGANVSKESKELAQEELTVLADINEENQGKEGYDADKLNVALTDIKTAVADAGSGITEEDVRKIVEETLNNYGLTPSMTSNQITLIVQFALNLANSSVIDSDGFKETLSSLKDSIVAKADDTFSGINLDFDASGIVESSKGIFSSIAAFFVGIWNAIVNFFSNLFG